MHVANNDNKNDEKNKSFMSFFQAKNIRIQQKISQQIASKLFIPFELISLIALKTLLFPESNYISFGSYTVRGDAGQFYIENLNGFD